MKKLAGLAFAALLWGATPAAAQLPLSVQRDLIAKEADMAWEAKKFDELPDLFMQYRALGKPLPTKMLRMQASVSAKNNDHAQVLKTLEIYFKTAKPDDDFYKVALVNYAKHKKLLNAPKPVPKPKSQKTLPNAVQKDLLERKIIKAATDQNNPALLAAFAKYRKQGFKMPPRYILSEAESAFKTNDIVHSKRALQEFFATGDKTKILYPSALDLFEKIEEAEVSAANPQKALQKVFPKKPSIQLKIDAKLDALYADAVKADVAGKHKAVLNTLEAFFKSTDVQHSKYASARFLFEKNKSALAAKTKTLEKYGRKRWGKSFPAVGLYNPVAIAGAYLAGSDVDDETVVMVHINGAGETVWEKTFSRILRLGDLAVNKTGIFLAGVEKEAGFSDYNEVYFHASVMKIDGNGKKTWQTRVNIPSNSKYTSRNSVTAMAILPNDKVLLAGNARSIKYPETSSEVFAAKLKNDGSVEWVRTYGGAEINSLTTTKDGGGLIGGYKKVSKTADFAKDRAYTEMMLLRLNKGGHVEWRKAYYVGERDGSINALASYPNGDTLIGGNVSFALKGEEHRTECGVALRIDENGKTLWRNMYTKGEITTVLAVPDGGALLGGQHVTPKLTTVIVIRVDAKGIVLWEKEFEVSNKPSIDSMMLTKDGGAILVMKSDLRGDTDYSMYAIRIDNVVGAPLKK